MKQWHFPSTHVESCHKLTYVICRLGAVPLVDLQPGQLRKLYRDLEVGGLSAQSIVHVHRVLQQAADDRHIVLNVALSVKPPRIQDHEMAYLAPSDAQAVMEAVQGSVWEPFIVTALHIGLRESELLGLRWADLELPLSRLHVCRSLHWWVAAGCRRIRSRRGAAGLSNSRRRRR